MRECPECDNELDDENYCDECMEFFDDDDSDSISGDNLFKSEKTGKEPIDEHYDEFMTQIWDED